MFDVSDRVAIVTGGARGFGKEFGIRLLRAGAKGEWKKNIRGFAVRNLKRKECYLQIHNGKNAV